MQVSSLLEVTGYKQVFITSVKFGNASQGHICYLVVVKMPIDREAMPFNPLQVS